VLFSILQLGNIDQAQGGGQQCPGPRIPAHRLTDVLVIGVDWDSGDVVKEKCKFICRGVKVQ
jgi:hypothetical protein